MFVIRECKTIGGLSGPQVAYEGSSTQAKKQRRVSWNGVTEKETLTTTYLSLKKSLAVERRPDNFLIFSHQLKIWIFYWISENKNYQYYYNLHQEYCKY